MQCVTLHIIIFQLFSTNFKVQENRDKNNYEKRQNSLWTEPSEEGKGEEILMLFI